jgi:hypothetical protein
MNRLPLLIFPLVASVTIACGTNSSRQLQSISIQKTAQGSQIQFVATGTFSAAPATVTPLPVAWSIGLLAPPPQQYTYTLTTQPFVFDCASIGSNPPIPVSAVAPSNPNAPSSGSLPMTKMISASLGFACP